MEIAFIIQARMGSTRLPEKILRPFYNGHCILDLLIEKIKQISNAKIIIATSTSSENDILEDYAKKWNVLCFRGDENDVLKRFIDAAELNNVSKIIRVCSDNPFLELKSMQQLFDVANHSDADYISFNVNSLPSIKTHYGFWTEYITLNTLKMIQKLTSDNLYHEHVTNYIYTHPENFKILWLAVPGVLSNRCNIRLTIDTLEDFQNAQNIYKQLCSENPYPTIDEIVEFLDKHTETYNTMVEQIKKNSK